MLNVELSSCPKSSARRSKNAEILGGLRRIAIESSVKRLAHLAKG